MYLHRYERQQRGPADAAPREGVAAIPAHCRSRAIAACFALGQELFAVEGRELRFVQSAELMHQENWLRRVFHSPKGIRRIDHSNIPRVDRLRTVKKT
jgi:hypothetical protein